MKATEKGCSGNRSKIGKDIYYKGRYYLAFYEDVENNDERYYAGFNNAIEICKYKKLPVTTTNVNMIYTRCIGTALQNRSYGIWRKGNGLLF